MPVVPGSAVRGHSLEMPRAVARPPPSALPSVPTGAQRRVPNSATHASLHSCRAGKGWGRRSGRYCYQFVPVSACVSGRAFSCCRHLELGHCCSRKFPYSIILENSYTLRIAN